MGEKKVTENKILGMATLVLVVVNSKLSFLWYNQFANKMECMRDETKFVGLYSKIH